MLKDAPILLLDEATTALDSEVEAAIQESFAALMEGKTVIAIAHRLSTIAAMDRLIVLDRGRIVEEGTTHDCSPAAASTRGCGRTRPAASSTRTQRNGALDSAVNAVTPRREAASSGARPRRHLRPGQGSRRRSAPSVAVAGRRGTQ